MSDIAINRNYYKYNKSIHILDARYKAIISLPIGSMNGNKFPNCIKCEHRLKTNRCKCINGCKKIIEKFKLDKNEI